jgi:hypothetical protein
MHLIRDDKHVNIMHGDTRNILGFMRKWAAHGLEKTNNTFFNHPSIHCPYSMIFEKEDYLKARREDA